MLKCCSRSCFEILLEVWIDLINIAHVFGLGFPKFAQNSGVFLRNLAKYAAYCRCTKFGRTRVLLAKGRI